MYVVASQRQLGWSASRFLEPDAGCLPTVEEVVAVLSVSDPSDLYEDTVISRARFRSRLRRAMRPTMQEMLELAELTPQARVAELKRRRRERVTTIVRAEGLLSPERQSELESLPDEQFWRAVRRLHSNPFKFRADGSR